MPNDERKDFPREYIFGPALSYPIIPTWRCDWMYWPHTRLFFSTHIFYLHRSNPIAGSFYQLGGGVGSENEKEDSTREGFGGFIGCLRQIYVDKLPAKVKRLSGFTLNSVFDLHKGSPIRYLLWAGNKYVYSLKLIFYLSNVFFYVWFLKFLG